MIMKNYLIACVSVLALTACGGGGGGGSSDSGSSPSGDGGNPTDDTGTTPPTTEVVAEVVPSKKTSELVVPEGFSYDSVDVVEITVDVSSLSTNRAYLSVYAGYSGDINSGLQADYGTRIAESPLSAGVASMDFSTPQHIDQLLIEVWFYDGTDPIQQLVSTSDTSINWVY
jgi:hypothetical protein